MEQMVIDWEVQFTLYLIPYTQIPVDSSTANDFSATVELLLPTLKLGSPPSL